MPANESNMQVGEYLITGDTPQQDEPFSRTLVMIIFLSFPVFKRIRERVHDPSTKLGAIARVP